MDVRLAGPVPAPVLDRVFLGELTNSDATICCHVRRNIRSAANLNGRALIGHGRKHHASCILSETRPAGNSWHGRQFMCATTVSSAETYGKLHSGMSG
jgi:hypothetical protein